jgi:hypothetical protein
LKSFNAILLFLILISGFAWAENKIQKKPEQVKLNSLLPPVQEGWIIKEKARMFTRENLFDYIDGGAELYLSYDFQRLLVQEYVSGENSIIVEIYEMKSPEDAFGLFSLNQEGESLSIGQGTSYAFGLLSFWKDYYFVRIIDMEGRDDRKDVIIDWGKGIADKIENEGKKPELLARIPQKNLLKQSLYYFHKNIILNNLYFLSNENILNLSEKTDAVLASYKSDSEILKLLLIEYPDTIGSKKAFESFNRNHLKTTISSLRNLEKVGEDLFTGVELKDHFLIVILEGKTKESVDNLINETKKSLVQRKVYK